MNEEKAKAVQQGLSGCAGAGCMIYLILFVLAVLGIILFAFISTPNPY